MVIESIDGCSYIRYYSDAAAVVGLMRGNEEEEAFNRVKGQGYDFGGLSSLGDLHQKMAYAHLESRVRERLAEMYDAHDEDK